MDNNLNLIADQITINIKSNTIKLVLLNAELHYGVYKFL